MRVRNWHYGPIAGAEGSPTLDPLKSKLISTDKDRLDETTTSPPGMREGSLQQIAGGVVRTLVHQNRRRFTPTHIRSHAVDEIWMVKGLPWVRISLLPRGTEQEVLRSIQSSQKHLRGAGLQMVMACLTRIDPDGRGLPPAQSAANDCHRITTEDSGPG